METGRVINRRYLLQRLVKQGQICAVYQGMDQVLQRVVMVKVVPTPHAPAYRLAIKMTAHFSHPNIVGLYDLVAEPEALYIVQEHIEGANFSTLLQTQLTAYEVADLGGQICQALIYAGSPTRGVCHGDLVPGAVIRDRTGLVRVNNFALPSDLYYFENWCILGGNGIAISNRDLPWGQQSDGRRDDDTRAVGLLLYQLLASRPQGASIIEPSPDGRLRFMRSIPPALCETVARAVVRQHPQHINTPEALYENLKPLIDALVPPLPVPVLARQAPGSYAREEPLVVGQYSPASPAGSPKLVSALPLRDTEHPGQSLSTYLSEQQRIKLPPPDALALPVPVAPTVADIPVKLDAARRAAYPEREVRAKRGSLAFWILVGGILAFLLLFLIGYFAGQLYVH